MTMSNENMAIVEHVNGTSLEAYQSRDEVRELTDRLLSLHPAASEVGKGGMLAVAQLALLVGASPLPGTNEIHVWKSGSKIQFQLGINFYRRKAQERGGVLWEIQPRQMRDDEREEYGVPKGVLAAVCKAARRDDVEKYMKAGFKANQIWEMVGRVGIGIANINEGKAGRTAIWTAFKRAEVDLYRALFPTMMSEIAQAQNGASKVVDNGPKWQEFSGDEIDDMFNYGERRDSSFPQMVDITDADYEDVAEDDFEQSDPDDFAKAGEIYHNADFWLEQAKSAMCLDVLAQAIYQYHLPSGVFGDATATKKAIKALCPNSRNEVVIATISAYVQSLADGAAVKDAKLAAKQKYEELTKDVQAPAQQPLFEDTAVADGAYQE